VEENNEMEKTQDNAEEKLELNGRPLRILVTDDSKLLRKKLRLELEKHGCEVLEAENGKEAVMKTLQEKPDGVFLDIVMPEVGGIEALRVLKEVSPDLPVIMLSSAGTPQKLMETLKLGALDFIQKPYTAAQIKKALESIRKKASSNE
jgi:DNA-binding response OmpR family regulator